VHAARVIFDDDGSGGVDALYNLYAVAQCCLSAKGASVPNDNACSRLLGFLD
jgi:hypothetical protein